MDLLAATSFAIIATNLIIVSLVGQRTMARGIAVVTFVSVLWIYSRKFFEFFIQTVFTGPCPYIIVYWILMLTMLLPIPFIARSNDGGSERLIILWRKFFHLIVLVLFIPPVWSGWPELDQLVALAGVLMLCLFSIMEAMRITGRPWNKLSYFLNHLIRPLLDYKDKGSRIVTSHLELLFAIVFPVWLGQVIGGEFAGSAYTLSGLVTVGVGDSAAAVGGICLTRNPHKLPWARNSKKSIEGFISFVLAVNIALWVLNAWDLIAFASTLVAAITEAYVMKYDNALLPLTYSFCRFLLSSFRT